MIPRKRVTTVGAQFQLENFQCSPGNVGFRAWPTMATAIAMAIVDYDGRLHPASSLLSRLPRKVRKRRSVLGHWTPPRRGTAGAAKLLPLDLGSPEIRGKFVLVYFIVFNPDLKEET